MDGGRELGTAITGLAQAPKLTEFRLGRFNYPELRENMAATVLLSSPHNKGPSSA